MKTTWVVHSLVFLLLLAVSTQALSVVFDTHSDHQSSQPHLSDADYDVNASEIPNNEPMADSNGLTCQHCCHCHSAQHIFLPLLIAVLPGEGIFPVRQTLALPPVEGHWRNLLRPPIA